MKKTSARRIIAALLGICVLTGCFAVFTHASTGSTENKVISVTQNPSGYSEYLVISKSELEDYSERGSFEISAVNGKFDNRGETYHAFFACYASNVVYDDGKAIPGEMTPAKTVLSFTADEKTDKIRFDSKAAEYEKATLFGGNAQYLWQIDADGDYTVIGELGGSGFFTSMYQYY